MGEYSLTSAILHELNENLGIGGAGSNLNSVANNFGGDTTLQGTNVDSAPSDLDLFRYSAPGVRSYNISSTAVSYFSVDGGNTDLVHFNQAGEGSPDYADWGDGNITDSGEGNTPPQIQDAYGSPYDGTAASIPVEGIDEVTALDAVGWDLTPTGTAIETGGVVPEPTTISLIGIAGMGLLARRRRV